MHIMVRTVQTIAFLTLTVVVAWFLRGTILLVVAGSLFGIALRAASVAVARVTRMPVVAAVWALVVVTVSLLLASAVLGGSAFVAQWAELWQTLHSSLNAALRELPR
ncbi:MAG TPA: hypothetical protein VFN49_06345, partial [Candidatus Aquilonibacter sp.]|nr:hypothetical protein [Candidatus Aquilonibacter sp.]